MLDSKVVTCPMDPSIQLVQEGEKAEVPHEQLIGSLMYLAVNSRPDIAFAASFLSQFNNCYTNEHWRAAKRVLRYK